MRCAIGVEYRYKAYHIVACRSVFRCREKEWAYIFLSWHRLSCIEDEVFRNLLSKFTAIDEPQIRIDLVLVLLLSFLLHFPPPPHTHIVFVIVEGLITIASLLSESLSLPTNLFRPKGPMFILCYMVFVVVVVVDDNVTKKRIAYGRRLGVHVEKNRLYIQIYLWESSLYIMHASPTHTGIVPSILYSSVHQHTSLFGY